MDDGSRSPLAGLIVLVMLILLNGILYGFAAAVRNLNQSEIQKMAEEGNKKAGLLKRLIDEPVRYVNAIPLIVTASGIFIGVFLVPLLARISHRYIDSVSGSGTDFDSLCCSSCLFWHFDVPRSEITDPDSMRSVMCGLSA